MAVESSGSENLNEEKKKFPDEQIKDLQMLLGKMDTTKYGHSESRALNHALATTRKDLGESSKDEWIIDNDVSDHMIT